jgi:hypothetical protein
VLPSLVIKKEYCRALHRGSKEPSRPGSLSCLTALENAPISRFLATKTSSISNFAAAFLPGSAKNVECDVTHSKQMTATFLPGATTTHIRAANERAAAFLIGPGVRLGRTKDSVRKSPFLTGSAPQTEFALTHSKQTLEKILTGARIHIKDSATQHIFARKTGLRDLTHTLAGRLPKDSTSGDNFVLYIPGTSE